MPSDKPTVELQVLNDLFTIWEVNLDPNPLAEYLEAQGIEVVWG